MLTLSFGGYEHTTYTVSINPSGTSVVTVLELHKKEPVITGNATYEIINTTHGQALKITGTGNLKFKAKQTDGLVKENYDQYLHDFNRQYNYMDLFQLL
ncbi:MAG: hypothetical protein ACE5J3_11310 [Methanosarcinales archaeon]